ncbi:MAG: hypothetical protein NTW87_11580 [Planctomycetota bacterium]|nr:hypothetical protein [Planctomycetota bacterium]
MKKTNRKTSRKTTKLNSRVKAQKAPKAQEAAPKALSAQEKAQDEAAAKAHSTPPKSKALPVARKNGTASIETVVSEAVGCHFVCETAQAPKQGFILSLSVKDEAVKLVARYVKPLKDGTLVMAFLPKLTQSMKKKGAVSQMPILAKYKGEACRVSWDVDQLADDLESTILDLLGAVKEPVPVDQIIEKTEEKAEKVLAALMVLEVRKLIRQQPGKRFMLA